MSSAHIMTTIRTFLGLMLAHFYLSGALGADNRKFPPDFKFGAATAAYQIEGAWNEDGKGESIWDYLTHTTPELIDDHSNADVACDSYHQYETDIALLKELGVDFYRFSLSWSRILPTGDMTGGINELGVKYYDNILNLLQENGIEAMVTLYHLDLPQPLVENFGGWTNESMINIFANYAKLAFDLFGDRVKYWVTINEPYVVCQPGNESDWRIPAIKDTAGVSLYLCSHNLLKSHAAAYHIYDTDYRNGQQGKVSIGLNIAWLEPVSDHPLDLEAIDRTFQFWFGWFAHPIVHGNYPQVMIDRVRKRSLQEGFEKSRLPEFTNQEIEYIKGTYDYIALNHYTTWMAQWMNDIPIGDPSLINDVSVHIFRNATWENSASLWLQVFPWGMRKTCKWIKDMYNNPEIIITENGFSDAGGILHDDRRINYITEYLSSLLEAIYDDGVKVTGYTVWSLMDDFEWYRGYSEKFGLYSVNFSDPNRNRTPKASANYYKNVVKRRCIVDSCKDHDLRIGAPNESRYAEYSFSQLFNL